MDRNHTSNRRWRWAHLLWAVLSGSVCVLLVFAKGGHPPPIVLVPLAAAVWLTVHVALLLGHRLWLRGVERASPASADSPSWPPVLVALLAVTSAAAALGLLQLIVSLLLARAWPFRGIVWGLMMLVWMLHGAGAAGLLLRRRWSLWVVAVLFVGWAVALVWAAVEPALLGYPQPAQIILACTAAVLLAGMAAGLLRSKSIRAFLAL